MKERDSNGEKTDLAKRLYEYVSKGQLVPDDLINPLFLDAIATKECKERGWIIDGYPRSQEHFDYMKNHGIIPNIVINLDVSDDCSISRQTGKVLDAKGRIFHLKFLPPPHDAKYEQEDFDKDKKSAKVRLELYHDYVKDFMQWYPESLIVDGEGKVEEVFQNIRDYIRKKMQ